MIRKYWKLLLITSVIILLPVVAGVFLWEQLPAQIPTHWGPNGEVDSYSSKAFAVFGLSGILLAAQWLCTLGSAADPKKQNHPEKVVHLVLWIIPVLSVVLYTITYATALGMEVPVAVVLPVLVGLMFVIIGNYMPKCKQNYTIGIKIPWTLDNEENWNKTHRFAGWLWTFCGVLIMVLSFFGGVWVLLLVMTLMVIAPCVYSYLLHRKGV